MNILVIIPARGNSKGIPQKNLRVLNGKPLIYYSIQKALKSKFKPDVYVSSEDSEILTIAQKCGAKIHQRPKDISDDKTTLDPVIFEACDSISKKKDVVYDFVVTMQPTSPLLKTDSLDNALEEMMSNKAIDTIISAKKESHLTWRKEKDEFFPNYKERVNRQDLDPFYVETGSFVICSFTQLLEHQVRLGNNISLFELSDTEGIDIDTFSDWNLCEYLLKRKTILFVVTGHKEVGLGHVYRSLILANSILNHKIVFLLDKDSQLGFEKIKANNYEVYLQDQNNILENIQHIKPDVIINDILDTSREYVKALRNFNIKVINFEDLGRGAREANLVINALYPEEEVLENHYFGSDYFCARDEFIMSKVKKIKKEVKTVLLTFGGTDSNNLTYKTLNNIYLFCQEYNIHIIVILGLGYDQIELLKKFKDITIYENVKNISDYMLEADLIFTSAGRTVYEIACIGTPTIVLAQNKRELTHFFASPQNGFINLGLGVDVVDAKIFDNFKRLINNYQERCHMKNLMLSRTVKKGKFTVINMIQQLIGAN